MLRPIAILLSKILFLIQVYNRSNIPKRGGVIIASNHLSFLDPIVLGVASPRPLFFMAKEELFKPRLFSWLITTLGAFQISPDKPDLKSIKKAISLLKNGGALVIFPEGTRSKDGKLLPGKPGCAFIAKISQATIVPTRIYGTNFALPFDSIFLHPYAVKVVFGRPFNIMDYPDLNLIELTETLMDKIRGL